jgi:hypothetical protein
MPGGSARAEYDRRRSKEEDEVRTQWGRFPRLAELIVKVSDETADTAAWVKGAIGEELLGQKLGSLPGVKVLHDRLRTGSRTGNIDHIVVASSGVWVVDAKHRSAKIRCVNKGNFLRPVLHLQVNGRSQKPEIDGVIKQAESVRGVLGEYPEVPVRPVLCFINTEWADGGPWEIRGTLVTWPRKLYKLIGKRGPLDAATIDSIHAELARGLRPAVQR